MKISRKELIKFFDEKSNNENHHTSSDVTAIIALLGEDLLLGALQHYWKRHEGANSKIVSYKCTPGSHKGSRLDAWLLKEGRKKELYQVELKNWAVYALGGEELKLDASQQELLVCSQKRWSHFFVPNKIPSSGNVRKVLESMKQPEGYESFKPIPLVCFWFYIAESVGIPYSKRRYSNGKEVHVFSASAYLRMLRDDRIELKMPRVARRKRLLSELIPAI